MIHLQLRCSHAHEFDGWFKTGAAFTHQVEAGLVECPECGDTGVSRALMAPNLGRKTNSRPTAPAPAASPPKASHTVIDQAGAPSPPPAPPAMPPSMPDELRAVLQKLRAEVESKCEHVGTRFAEEARAIHNGESEARGIYGEATPEQAEALAEDGIEVARIPWVRRADG